MKTTAMTTTKKKKCGLFRKIMTGAGIMSAMASMSATTAFASFGEDVTVTANGGTDASTMMGKIIGILLTITRFVGVALVVYGVYEVVMSFMQNQPEAKTKRMMKTKMNCTKKFEKSTQRKKLETNPAKFPAVQTNFL